MIVVYAGIAVIVVMVILLGLGTNLPKERKPYKGFTVKMSNDIYLEPNGRGGVKITSMDGDTPFDNHRVVLNKDQKAALPVQRLK